MQRDTWPHVQYGRPQRWPWYNKSGHSQVGSERSSRRCLRHGPRLQSSPEGVGLVCRSCRRCPIYGLDVIRGTQWMEEED